VFDKAEGILKQRRRIEGSSYQQKQKNKAKMIKTEKKMAHSLWPLECISFAVMVFVCDFSGVEFIRHPNS